jgi:hypothetical protein
MSDIATITTLLRNIAVMGETHAARPDLDEPTRATALNEAALLREAASRIEAVGLAPLPAWDMDPFDVVALWRPIATAPQDGTRILAILPCGSQVVVHWVALDAASGWYLYHQADRGWRLSASSQPTHWQPLGPGPLV